MSPFDFISGKLLVFVSVGYFLIPLKSCFPKGKDDIFLKLEMKAFAVLCLAPSFFFYESSLYPKAFLPDSEVLF